MKTSKLLIGLIILLLLTGLSIGTVSAQEEPKVRALFFYSPTCQFCQQVMSQDLPPLFEQYGDQLIILGVDVSTQIGSEFLQAALGQIEDPPDRIGVPLMLIADKVLIGAIQIPQELPGMIESGLSTSGIAWPDLPAVQEYLFSQGFIDEQGQDTLESPQAVQVTEATATPEPTETPQDTPEDTPQSTATSTLPAPTKTPVETLPEENSAITLLDPNAPAYEPGSVMDRFMQDKIANGIAVLVLLVMIGVVVWIGFQFMQAATPRIWPAWILPVLLIVGFAIAVYLGLIEVTGDEAICGPVGDCNAVQQSKYAKLFGVIPVAILGMLGYISIGISWVVSLKTTGKVQFYAKMAMFLFALFGILFFIYLTFLEPFVIGATCAWCISSAIIMTLINLITTPIALHAWAEIDME